MTKCDFHIFRRFRASWLRKNCVPWDLEKMWMGHTHKEPHGPIRRTATRGREIPPQMVRNDSALVSFCPPMFRNFRNQDTQQSLQESSMKLLNLLGIKWSALYSRRFSNLDSALPRCPLRRRGNRPNSAAENP